MQQRDKHLVKRNTQNRGFIRWSTRVGAVINRVLSRGHLFNGKHREAFNFVVVTGVITKRTFVSHFLGVYVALQDNLRVRGYEEFVVFTSLCQAVCELGLATAQ